MPDHKNKSLSDLKRIKGTLQNQISDLEIELDEVEKLIEKKEKENEQMS